MNSGSAAITISSIQLENNHVKLINYLKIAISLFTSSYRCLMSECRHHYQLCHTVHNLCVYISLLSNFNHMASMSLCTLEHVCHQWALLIIYRVNIISLYANISMPSLCTHTRISIFWLFQQFGLCITELTIQEFRLCILLQSQSWNVFQKKTKTILMMYTQEK